MDERTKQPVLGSLRVRQELAAAARLSAAAVDASCQWSATSKDPWHVPDSSGPCAHRRSGSSRLDVASAGRGNQLRAGGGLKGRGGAQRRNRVLGGTLGAWRPEGAAKRKGTTCSFGERQSR
jgi:hypothetical protein